MNEGKIIKKYFDIEVIYEGNKNDMSAYRDWENWNLRNKGVIGILTIELNTETKEKKELCFRQILKPMNCAKLLDYCDLLVTWNGRDFDNQIISNTFHHEDYWYAKDRDLLDICLKRNVEIRGGLGAVVKRLRLDKEISCKDKEVLDFYNHVENIFDDDINRESDEYKRSLSIVLKRNEFDVRVLPLIEEKMGLLYEGRRKIDEYHKAW